MSYFEVYNEKIHDLLVARDEPNQRRMPVSVFSDSLIIFSISIQYVLILIWEVFRGSNVILFFFLFISNFSKTGFGILT